MTESKKLHVSKLIAFTHEVTYPFYDAIERLFDFRAYVFSPLIYFLRDLTGKTLYMAFHTTFRNTLDANLVDHTDSLLSKISDFCVFGNDYYNMVVIEAYKRSLFSDHKSLKINFNKVLPQLLTSMLSGHIDRGIMTDGFNVILVKIDHERVAELKSDNTPNKRAIPISYRVLGPMSAGVTLRAGLLAFLYECVSLKQEDFVRIEEQMNELYTLLKKPEGQYLKDMERVAAKKRGGMERRF